jgi:hypothetical protein
LPVTPNKPQTPAPSWPQSRFKNSPEQAAGKREENKAAGAPGYAKGPSSGDHYYPAYLRRNESLLSKTAKIEGQGKRDSTGGTQAAEEPELFFFEHASGGLRANTPTTGLEVKPIQAGSSNPGEDEFIFGEDEMDVPAFIKTLAN